MVKSLAAIGELIKTAATIRSTRIVRFMHEVCSCGADAVWTFTFTNGSSSAPAPKLHDCRDARRQLNVRSRMFLRGEASDHCHHFESFEICRCLQSFTEQCTFVRQFHPSLTGAPVLAEPTTSTPLTVLSTTRERGINADKKGVDLDVHLRGRRQGATDDVSSQQFHRLVEPRSPHQRSWHSVPFFFVMHDTVAELS